MTDTIKRADLARMAFLNSPNMPQVVNDRGRRKQWVGIGWIDEGEAGPYDTVVED